MRNISSIPSAPPKKVGGLRPSSSSGSGGWSVDRGPERFREVVTPSKRRGVSSWKAEHATLSIQNGSELGSSVQPGGRKLADCLLDGDI